MAILQYELRIRSDMARTDPQVRLEWRGFQLMPFPVISLTTCVQ